MKKPNQTQRRYICPDRIVELITKKSNLKRWPAHSYPCSLLLLRPRRGTRVQMATDGRIEYMPSYREIRELLIAIDVSFAKILPRFMRNKPEERKKYYDRKNAKRHGKK